jgi:DNA-binding transcriptional LysR family regulator
VDGDAGAREAEPEEDEQEVALDFRLLRYFIAVAEELHLARAAERLGIEQSPVSRAMRDLESQLGVQLFDRSTRLTRLTWAGQVFLGECRRVQATVEQAVKSAKAAAQGYQGHLRIAICDSLAQPRIATLLARSREDEPELEIRVFELPFAQQLKTLHDDLLDIGFALSNAVHDGLVAEPVWTDPLSVIVPARHPLLAHVQVPLAEALKFPLVLCHPESGSGCRHQIQALLQDAGTPLKLVDEVTSLGVMLTLVGAGLLGAPLAPAWAQFRVEVSGVGAKQIPVAIAPFQGSSPANADVPAIIRAGEPLVSGWLGLPPEASAAFVMGFLRRDFGATGLFVMAESLSPIQAVVGMITITLFIPCFASLMMMVKEQGTKTAMAMVGMIVPFAFLIGGLFNLVLRAVW